MHIWSQFLNSTCPYPSKEEKILIIYNFIDLFFVNFQSVSFCLKFLIKMVCWHLGVESKILELDNSGVEY